MPDTRVLSLNHVVTTLKLKTPEPATQHVEGAYLCVHKIPVSALCDESLGRLSSSPEKREYNRLADYVSQTIAWRNGRLLTCDSTG